MKSVCCLDTWYAPGEVSPKINHRTEYWNLLGSRGMYVLWFWFGFGYTTVKMFTSTGDLDRCVSVRPGHWQSAAQHIYIYQKLSLIPANWKTCQIYVQGVQQNCLHLVICSFVGFYSCKLQKVGHFWKIQEICYMIGTRILKIALEIAEIIEVKVATFNMEIIFLPLWNTKMYYLSYFWIDFCNLHE